jgi:hypothetical protein
MLKTRTTLIVTAAVAAPSIFLLGAIIGSGSSGRDIAHDCRVHSSFKHIERDSETVFSCQEIKRPVARL